MKDEQTEKMAAQPAPEPSSALNQCLNKFNQSIKDESKIQRKNALESIKKQLIEFFRNPNASIQFTAESLDHILNQVLNLFTDPMERCRELSCDIAKLLMEKNQYWDLNMTGMVVMCVFQRLGAKDIKETSEEIRLQLYTLIHELILAKCSSQKNTFEIHLQEFIAILVNSFADNFPEVKKMGCACAKLLANRLAKSNFHMQSESLVKPMLNNMTHQHSRVRKDVIECLCDVVMYGNNKSVSDVVPHLAQRLFDQANIVRVAVIKLVGTWLLDLPDRYSFHYKLIPLLLTGFIDESPEIKELTESLWWDVGIKYEKENETELKDKLDFMEIQIANYPDE
ncbi:dynein assembly factor axonemal-like, partial [Brachionus plicatilis]